MKHAFRRSIVAPVALAAVLVLASLTGAQPPQQAQASEIYHVHVVKAAPGKLAQLINEYKNAPGPSPDEPQVSPIILRHREGSEWDLIVITPLGKKTTITADPVPQAVQAYYNRIQPLTDWHGDTFAVGPSWATVKKALVPEKNTQQAVYIVGDYRAVAGHRSQLQQVLAGDGSDANAVLFTHAEGAPWNFLTVTRYDSWAAAGAAPPLAQGAQPAPDAGFALREHLAVHHDTICSYVSGGQPVK
jgi:hypothetical protein